MDNTKSAIGKPAFRCLDYVFQLAGDPDLVARLEPLFVDLSTDPVPDPHLWFAEAFGGHARVQIDDKDPEPWVARELFTASAISTLTLAVIADNPASLHLHAGAIVHDSSSVLLLSPSGSGKSTLTCALVAAGAQYLTDEVVAVSPDGQSTATFPKPISVKRSGIHEVERLTGLTCPHETGPWEIPASTFGSIALAGDYPVSTLAFNSYAPGQSPRLAPLHRSTAVRRLLSDSQDVALFGAESLMAAAGLAQSAHCFEVAGGDAAEMARVILEANRTPVEPGEVEPVPAPTADTGPRRGDGVCSVVTDGRAVLYTPEPHQLVELDEAQTLWWALLDGTPFDKTIAEVAEQSGLPHTDVVAAGNAAMESFRALGVLHDA